MKRNDVAPILALINRLTRQDGLSEAQCDANMHWLLCWLATPLQRPGTKLQTAVVIQGAQGSGKSLLAQAMLKIYGEQAAEVGPEQLHSVFTDWISQKTFVAVEEGFSSRNLFRDFVKKLITSPTIEINTKHQPVRVEPNKANFIFLSGEAHSFAFASGEGQRRFFVIEPKAAPRDPGFFVEIMRWIESEGSGEAFRQYLLEYPVTDFSFGGQPKGLEGSAA
ncbi:MAG: hypothetical protein A2710_03690 [Burkholderiales bacterium RIFCSPHIGHO2_01_FULL_64_960]|nr:MAG: hypothetical protein A2710_03690 [Burkholderiales bacterium RIFCSPHIGHO2_01_FULL_64_960]